MINYFSQVIRSQRVKKSLTLINITGLSVCIATALLIILYVWSELSYDSFHNTERVYRVESRLYEGKTLTDNWATTAYGHAPAMARDLGHDTHEIDLKCLNEHPNYDEAWMKD